MSWENTVKAFPFKGSAKRQRDGWDEKLRPTEYSSWMDSDTNRFTQILFDAHGWSKKEQEQFMEHLVDEPEMWQDKYEVFRRALDLRHYSNDRIEDDLSEHSFADWFKEEFDADWDDLDAYLRDIELKRANEKSGQHMWKSILQKENPNLPKDFKSTGNFAEDAKKLGFGKVRTLTDEDIEDYRRHLMGESNVKTPQERVSTTTSTGQDEEAAKRAEMDEHELLEELKRKNAGARSNLQPSKDKTFEMGWDEKNKKIHRKAKEKAERQREMDKAKQTGLGDF